MSHCLVVVVMTTGIAIGPARVMARRAFAIMGAGEEGARTVCLLRLRGAAESDGATKMAV